MYEVSVHLYVKGELFGTETAVKLNSGLKRKVTAY